MTDEERPDDEMTHMEFLRAQFFSSDADHAAHVAEIEARRSERDARNAKRRKCREDTAGIRALAAFARAMEKADPAERRASIAWLADKFLGVRLRLPL